jgi:L-alanine-DL-glutamate epimerase-like enolase superfamily enzyme
MISYKDIDVLITEVEGFSLSSPYGSGDSFGQPKGVKSIGLVQIHTNIGVSGLGETYAGVYSPSLIKPIVEFLKESIIGMKVGDDEVIENLSKIPFIGRNGLLKGISSAIEIALWDVRGKLLNEPVSSLINHRLCENKINVYASGGSVTFSPSQIKEDVEMILRKGFSAYKMRVGYQDWNIDLERIESARTVLQNNKLMVDAIMGTLTPPWSTKIAFERVKSMDEFNLYWLEEPLHPDNINGLSELRKFSDIPIAAGEAYSGFGEYQSLLDQDSVDFLQFDATFSGGILPCVKLAAEANKRSLKCAIHVWGSAVAISSNAQVAMSSNYVDYLEMPMVSLEINKEMWASEPIIKDGFWIPSDIPGLGVNLEESTKKRYKLVPGSGYSALKK